MNIEDIIGVEEGPPTDPAAEEEINRLMAEAETCRKEFNKADYENIVVAFAKEKDRRIQLEKMIEDLHGRNGRGSHGSPEANIACILDALITIKMDAADDERDLKNKTEELQKLYISFNRVRDGAREACARLRKKLSDNTGIKNKRAELASCLWCKTTVINPNSDNCPACGNELYPVSRIVDGFILVKNEYFLKSTPHQRKKS